MRLQPLISSLSAFVVGVVSIPASSPHDSSQLRTRELVFRSQIQHDTNLRYVANSGICETTPGVTQYSGYIDVGTNMSMWFWFFEARNSPETAPFTLWLNGGPGCSSLIGLFQENGPCLVNADGKSTYLNPYSWNNVSNMIYIDQPIGAGFSYGTHSRFQILFESKLFSEYASREFILATESFGGHYGPGFVTYFDEQNALIAKGAIQGEPVVVSAVMINNGWVDPLIQNIAYYPFASNAPGYGQLQSDDVLKNISAALYGPNGCVAQEKDCYTAGTSSSSIDICHNAQDYCVNNVYGVAVGDRDPYDLHQNSSALFPPDYYMTYLTNPEVMATIGAETAYQQCSDVVNEIFNATGDEARTWLPQLSAMANSGLKILIWAGDADIICNWLGVYDSVLAMDWYGNGTLHNTPLSNITLDGKPIAAVANVDNFTFARVFEAGHEAPAYQPAAALEIFTQIINKEPLHSVEGSG
ncbi:Alpha/Beta hydrolase protein [Boletus edulis]|nr:Alpha/Beta hydrolase protein [Boletus edulis]